MTSGRNTFSRRTRPATRRVPEKVRCVPNREKPIGRKGLPGKNYGLGNFLCLDTRACDNQDALTGAAFVPGVSAPPVRVESAPHVELAYG